MQCFIFLLVLFHSLGNFHMPYFFLVCFCFCWVFLFYFLHASRFFWQFWGFSDCVQLLQFLLQIQLYIILNFILYRDYYLLSINNSKVHTLPISDITPSFLFFLMSFLLLLFTPSILVGGGVCVIWHPDVGVRTGQKQRLWCDLVVRPLPASPRETISLIC